MTTAEERREKAAALRTLAPGAWHSAETTSATAVAGLGHQPQHILPASRQSPRAGSGGSGSDSAEGGV